MALLSSRFLLRVGSNSESDNDWQQLILADTGKSSNKERQYLSVLHVVYVPFSLVPHILLSTYT